MIHRYYSNSISTPSKASRYDYNTLLVCNDNFYVGVCINTRIFFIWPAASGSFSPSLERSQIDRVASPTCVSMREIISSLVIVQCFELVVWGF